MTAEARTSTLRSVWRSQLGPAVALAVAGVLVGLGLITPGLYQLGAAGVLNAAGVAALCFIFPTALPQTRINLAHAVGMGVLFIYGPVAASWCLIVGLLAAAALRQGLRWGILPFETQGPPTWESLALELNRQVIPLVAAGAVYAALGGQFPTEPDAPGLLGDVLGFALTYFGLYNLFLLAEIDPAEAALSAWNRTDAALLILLQLLPLPLSLFASSGYRALGQGLLFTLSSTLVVIALSLYGLTRAQARLRHQMQENLRLVGQTQARLREQEILYEVGVALAATLDRAAVYSTISARLAQIIGANSCAMLEYDGQAGQWRVAFQWPASKDSAGPGQSAFAEADFPPAGRVRQEGRPYTASLAAAPDPGARAWLEQLGAAAALVVPLRVSEEVVGAAVLTTGRPRGFSEADIRLAQTLANQAAIAAANARLFHGVQESRDRLAAVLNSTREGVMVIQGNGQILLVNPRLEELWGLPADRLLNGNLLALADEPDLGLKERLGFERAEIEEMLLTLKAGLALSISRAQFAVLEPRRRFLERTGAPVLDHLARAIGWVIILRDVTEERELQEMRDALSGMIVHDLRSPLTAVLASTSLLAKQLPEPARTPVVSQALEVSRRSVKRLINMVNTLLDIARMESGDVQLERSAFILHSLVAEVTDDLLPLANEYGLFLISQVSETLPPVVADRDKIMRVLGNLIGNALKFTPAGGSVEICAEAAAGRDGRPLLECCVLDTGPGIPVEYQARIFNRFVQVGGWQGRQPGTGLGLAFCKLAVEAHGGRIWAENRPQGGAAFRFTLPFSPE